MLPFDAEVLYSFFAQFNRALWPAQIAAWLLGAFGLYLAFRPSAVSGRIVGVVLVAAWALCGVLFHYLHFATINFVAPFYGAFFVAQGILLALALLARERAFRATGRPLSWLGAGLVVFALFGVPLFDGLAGHGWQSVRLFALTPEPTALYTVGMLLLIEGRTPLHLLVIPTLWAVVAGATAWRLGALEDLLPPLLILFGVALALLKTLRVRER